MRKPQLNQPTDSKDGPLLDRLRHGDEGAVSDLAGRYGSKIFQLAFRYLKNREDAEEVVQDVLMKVFRNIDAFRGDSALSSWIYRITFNTAMSRLRATKATRALETDEPVAVTEMGQVSRVEPPDWSNMADERILRGQMRSRLAEAVVQLPPIYRAPVILRDFRGLSTEEASVALRVKDQTFEVTPASRPFDAAAPVRGLCWRTQPLSGGFAKFIENQTHGAVRSRATSCLRPKRRLESHAVAGRETGLHQLNDSTRCEQHGQHCRAAGGPFLFRERNERDVHARRSREGRSHQPRGRAREGGGPGWPKSVRSRVQSGQLRRRQDLRRRSSADGRLVPGHDRLLRAAHDRQRHIGRRGFGLERGHGDDGRPKGLRCRSEESPSRQAQFSHTALDQHGLHSARADNESHLIQSGYPLEQRQAVLVTPLARRPRAIRDDDDRGAGNRRNVVRPRE